MSKQAANQVETPAQAARHRSRTPADQDAQQAKQAQQAIAYAATPAGQAAIKRSPGNAQAIKDAALAITAPRAAARKAQEQAAQASNARTLAAAKANAPAPKPKALAVGSGAAVGVAQGAMDHQPHTKRAVEEARAKLAKPTAHIVDVAGNVITEPNMALVVGRVQYPNKARAADARTTAHQAAVQAQLGKPAKPKAAPAPKQPKAPKQAKVEQNYKISKGPTAYTGAPGSWTHYMVTHSLAHKTTDDAKAARKDQWMQKPLHWSWMVAKGYVVLKA